MVNRYHAHQLLVKKTKLFALAKYPKSLRLHDRHVGLLYTRNGAPMQINKKGMADLYGYFSCHKILVHIEAEAKTGKAVQTKEQKDWQRHIESMGGCYILFRSEQDFVDQLESYLKSRKLI